MCVLDIRNRHWWAVCGLLLLGLFLVGIPSVSQAARGGTTDDSFLRSLAAVLLAATEEDLPSPTHSLDLGYAFVDDPQYGDYWNEVNGYTNLYISNPPDDENWEIYLDASLQRAVSEGKTIYLGLDMPVTCTVGVPDYVEKLNAILDVAEPYWNNIKYIQLANEPEWGGHVQIDWCVDMVTANLDARGLRHPLLGVMYMRKQLDDLRECGQPNRIILSKLDWLGFAPYLKAPGSPDSAVNQAELHDLIGDAKCKAGDKDLILSMQAYDISGAWTNMRTLVDLQIPVYMDSYDDPQVRAIMMFAYGRDGGTRDHPELKVPHRAIWSALSIEAGEALDPPDGLTAYALVGLQSWVDLDWNDNSTIENRFAIHRQVDGGDWEFLDQVGPDITHYTDKTAFPPTSGSTQYCYRVRAVVNKTYRSAFSVSACMTMYHEAPPPPELDALSGCVDTLRPAFTWSQSERATSYWVVVIHEARSLIAYEDSGETLTSFTLPGDLLAGEVYYWKVKAINNAGGAWSDLQFFTPLCDYLGGPTLLSPPPGTCIDTPTTTFTWGAVPGAETYRLVITPLGPDDFFDIPHTSDTSMTPTFDPALIPGQIYRWKVKGGNSAVDGTYSIQGIFTHVCTDTAGVATTIAPRGTVTTSTPTYVWGIAHNTTEYCLTVGEYGGASLFYECYTAADMCAGLYCSVTPPLTLTEGMTYTLGVMAYNDLGPAPYSSVAPHNFKVSLPSSPAPGSNTPTGLNVLVAPTSGLTLTFETILATGATSATLLPPDAVQDVAYEVFPSYAPAGPVYDIATDARFAGPVTLKFALPVSDATTLANLRILHEEAEGWVDRTLSGSIISTSTGSLLSARVNSFSRFAVVQVITPALPTVDSQMATTSLGRPITLSLTGTVADEALVRRIRFPERPAHGQLLAGGEVPASVGWSAFTTPDFSVTYIPDPGFIGNDSFAFQIDDSVRPSALATVTLSVSGHRLFMPLILR